MILFGILSIVIHSIFLYSVFDIYFKSPIIHGMTPYSTPISPPAKRLVLIVADGMRADKFFEVSESGETNSPFLRFVCILYIHYYFFFTLVFNLNIGLALSIEGTLPRRVTQEDFFSLWQLCALFK